MSVLPNNTFASPGNPYYSPIGGVGANLQSPVIVIPEPGGDASLTVQSVAPGAATIEALGANGEIGSVVVGSGGAAYRMATGVGGVPDFEIGALGPGVLPAFQYNYLTGNTTIGDASLGTVATRQPLVVNDVAMVGGNGIGISPTSATGGVIAMTCATGGTLLIGSSVAQSGTLTIADAGTDHGVVAVGGNNGTDILLTGGNNLGTFANIRANLANQGTITLGSSSANPVCMYLTDGVGAGTGSVDITNGTAASGTLKLQGGDGAGFCHIYPNFASAGIQIGSSSGTTNAIEVADTGITMNTPVYFQAPSYANYSPTILAPTGSIYTGVFNIGLGGLPTGYWMILGKTANIPSGADRTSMFSTIVYVVGGLIKAGGTGAYPTYWTTIPNAADDSQLTVTLSSPTTTNYSIVAMPINYA